VHCVPPVVECAVQQVPRRVRCSGHAAALRSRGAPLPPPARTQAEQRPDAANAHRLIGM
jgi:hypothetical protein